MSTGRNELLDWIERDRDELVRFLQDFVRHRSPNPPGDTRSTAKFITTVLDQQRLPYRVISPHPEMPNIVGAFDCANAGRHLVLNGHIDVFPVADDGAGWSKDPWGGEIVDGKIYGRGVADMKAGTTASIFTYAYLHRLKDQLKGRLTLTAVSDEETFGPYGARYLMEHHPEVHGDALLNGEPSSPFSVRFGEKGPLWLEITVNTAVRTAHTRMPARAQPKPQWQSPHSWKGSSRSSLSSPTMFVRRSTPAVPRWIAPWARALAKSSPRLH